MSALDRELKVLRGMCSCLGDDAAVDEAERELAELRAEIERLRAANIGLATESHELQQEVERLGSVADAEMKLREGNFAEIKRLRADAERLRWLLWSTDPAATTIRNNLESNDPASSLAAIDAARARAAPGDSYGNT